MPLLSWSKLSRAPPSFASGHGQRAPSSSPALAVQPPPQYSTGSAASSTAPPSRQGSAPELGSTIPTLPPNELEQKVLQIQEDLLQPVREVLGNDASAEMVAMADMFLNEAQCGVELLQSQVEGCIACDRFDLLEQIANVASTYEDMRMRIDEWRNLIAIAREAQAHPACDAVLSGGRDMLVNDDRSTSSHNLAAEQPRRARAVGITAVARASARSSVDEIRKAFHESCCGSARDFLALDDLLGYMCDFLGFGQAEAHDFYRRCERTDGVGGVTFDGFTSEYVRLNPYMISNRTREAIVRKPGSISSQQLNLENLVDSDVYVCDRTAQVFVDDCKRCQVLLGPCESSVFIRGCEGCRFWIAAQQLRTYDCSDCTFHLYSKTEPVIETSTDLAFAPWAAKYPLCTAQFLESGFDAQRNMWNAIFDFSGKHGRSNWRILPLEDVTELSVSLNDPDAAKCQPDGPGPPVSYQVLCAEPLTSEGSVGHGVAGIPQTRPPNPSPPAAGTSVAQREFLDFADGHALETLSNSDRSNLDVATNPDGPVPNSQDNAGPIAADERHTVDDGTDVLSTLGVGRQQNNDVSSEMRASERNEFPGAMVVSRIDLEEESESEEDDDEIETDPREGAESSQHSRTVWSSPVVAHAEGVTPRSTTQRENSNGPAVVSEISAAVVIAGTQNDSDHEFQLISSANTDPNHHVDTHFQSVPRESTGAVAPQIDKASADGTVGAKPDSFRSKFSDPERSACHEPKSQPDLSPTTFTSPPAVTPPLCKAESSAVCGRTNDFPDPAVPGSCKPAPTGFWHFPTASLDKSSPSSTSSSECTSRPRSIILNGANVSPPPAFAAPVGGRLSESPSDKFQERLSPNQRKHQQSLETVQEPAPAITQVNCSTSEWPGIPDLPDLVASPGCHNFVPDAADFSESYQPRDSYKVTEVAKKYGRTEFLEMVEDFSKNMVKGKLLELLMPNGGLMTALCSFSAGLDILRIQVRDKSKVLPLAEIADVLTESAAPVSGRTVGSSSLVTLVRQTSGERYTFKISPEKALDIFVVCMKTFARKARAGGTDKVEDDSTLPDRPASDAMVCGSEMVHNNVEAGEGNHPATDEPESDPELQVETMAAEPTTRTVTSEKKVCSFSYHLAAETQGIFGHYAQDDVAEGAKDLVQEGSEFENSPGLHVACDPAKGHNESDAAEAPPTKETRPAEADKFHNTWGPTVACETAKCRNESDLAEAPPTKEVRPARADEFHKSWGLTVACEPAKGPSERNDAQDLPVRDWATGKADEFPNSRAAGCADTWGKESNLEILTRGGFDGHARADDSVFLSPVRAKGGAVEFPTFTPQWAELPQRRDRSCQSSLAKCGQHFGNQRVSMGTQSDGEREEQRRAVMQIYLKSLQGVEAPQETEESRERAIDETRRRLIEASVGHGSQAADIELPGGFSTRRGSIRQQTSPPKQRKSDDPCLRPEECPSTHARIENEEFPRRKMVKRRELEEEEMRRRAERENEQRKTEAEEKTRRAEEESRKKREEAKMQKLRAQLKKQMEDKRQKRTAKEAAFWGLERADAKLCENIKADPQEAAAIAQRYAKNRVEKKMLLAELREARKENNVCHMDWTTRSGKLAATADSLDAGGKNVKEFKDISCSGRPLASSWPLPMDGRNSRRQVQAVPRPSVDARRHSGDVIGQRATMHINCPYQHIAGDVAGFKKTFSQAVADATGVSARRVKVFGVRSVAVNAAQAQTGTVGTSVAEGCRVQGAASQQSWPC